MQDDDYWAKHDNPKGKKDAKREEQVGAPLRLQAATWQGTTGCMAAGAQHARRSAAQGRRQAVVQAAGGRTGTRSSF